MRLAATPVWLHLCVLIVTCLVGAVEFALVKLGTLIFFLGRHLNYRKNTEVQNHPQKHFLFYFRVIDSY